MSTQEHQYEVNITWNEGRVGTMSSPALDESIKVATPPEFPGGVEGIWSPEHLFVSSVSSCFMTTFLAIAEYSKLDYESLKVEAVGTMGKVDGKFAMTDVILRPVLEITDEKQEAKALRIMEKAEAACLITRSITSNMIFEPKVLIGTPH